MPAREVFDLINTAIDNHDAELVEQLMALLQQHGQKVQPKGAMAPHYILPDTPEVQEALIQLGIEPSGLAEEGLGLDIANAIAHAQRRIEFYFDKKLRPELPTLVAEGDSWFLHQLLEDTLDHLRESHFNVCSMAAAGDTVDNMLATDNYLEEILDENSRVFLFSGGGNDLLGDGRVGKSALPENVDLEIEELINDSFFQPLLENVIKDYKAMLETLAQQLPGVQVFSHGYDYVTRIDKGPWIWPYLEAKGYSIPRARALVAELLDRFNTRLLELDQIHSNFTYVNTRDLVGASVNAWYDAIHPKSAGFERVAKKFTDEVQAFLSQPSVETAIVSGESMTARSNWNKPPRGFASKTAEPTIEAVINDYSHPNLTDFEATRKKSRAITRDKARWLHFRDPQVTKHIEDVLTLLCDIKDKEDPQRLQNRAEMRLAGNTEGAVQAYELVEERAPLNQAEALFGASEIEPIQILLKGYQSARAVARVQVMSPHGSHIGHGTGFMVAPGLFLTNQHVLRNADEARRSYVIFDDETPLDGALSHPSRFRINGEIYAASKEADYAFVSVELVNNKGLQLSEYGYLPLIEPSGKAVKFEPVSIIQHPGGGAKAIAMRNSFIMGRVDDGVYYTTDTKGGSSGSPVLNREWQVVALHHRYVPHPIDADDVLANRGVRISSIYSDLRDKHSRGESMATQVLHILSTDQSEGLMEQVSNCPQPEVEAIKKPPVAETVDEGVYAGLYEKELLEAIAHEYDNSEGIPLPDVLKPVKEHDFTELLVNDRDTVLRRIGAEGYRFIIAHEVSSYTYYQRKLRHPIKPGGASGVTIGIGYDLGHQTLEGFRQHWSGLLQADDMRRLEVCIGKKREAAAAALRTVQDIDIPYETAIKVFERDSLPRYFGYLNQHIHDETLESLSPECVAALVSLTFNRGASFQRVGDRYREMRSIRSALNEHKLALVPDLLRSMKRLWEGRENLRGLIRRRDEEADLFEQGIDECLQESV